jgi:hypothetical protein
MAISNRDLDNAQTRETIYACLGPVVTGATFLLGPIPYPAQVVAAQTASMGLSGAPVHALLISRFIVGTGYTTIGLNATLTISAIGTSGPQGYSTASFAGSGASGTPLYPGDDLILVTGAANTATANTSVAVVIKALQDVKTHFGF